MTDTNVRLQNLRDFTVQIHRADTDAIVGTGIAVSTDGKIVTCAHVVEAAGVDSRNANGAEVGVYFPQARGGEQKKRKAIVEKFFPRHDDDVVQLRLADGSSPLAPEQIAVLGTADLSERHPFQTYGYSPIGMYPASRGEGVILGSIEPPPDRNLHVDPIQLKSREIAAGMSGAAVLDVTRNLVVGLVAERYYPKGTVQDDIGFGVDSKVLTFDPFDFELRGEALALKPAPEFRLDKDLFEQAIEITNYALAHRPPADKYSWNNAPAVLSEWTGRDELLAQITSDWMNPQKRVTGLIGFGGEGKSSLARKWVESVISPLPYSGEGPGVRADGVFWWGFYENRSVDEFLEAALDYLSGGRIDPKAVPSSSLRAQIIGAMLGSGRYLFVLDGLEVMQHQEGDQYGLLQSNDLRNLLTYFARPDNASFCLITSRAPLLDLMEYTTYAHHDVDRLLPADGRALLKRLGVNGSDAALDKVVSDWDGHALTLSLLGSYLSEHFGGDLAHLANIPTPTADEPRYERVHRVLRRYDEHLSGAEREFLKLFSAFRTPVHESAFEKVFQPLLSNTLTAENAENAEKELKNSADSALSAVKSLVGKKKKKISANSALSAVKSLVARLVAYRLLRHDAASQTYTAHPLVRNHYFALFTKGDPSTGSGQALADTHNKIKDYYLSLAGDTSQYPTLDDLKPLIEVVHHACEAGAYDEAWRIYWDRIRQGEKRVTIHQLGAYETELSLIQEFFPDRDTSQLPLVSDKGNQRFLLNAVGLCLMSLGCLREAAPFYERKNKIALEMQDWSNASAGCRNLASLHTYLGALEASAAAARQALTLARRAENKQDEYVSLTYQAWALHLTGDLFSASIIFEQAEALIKELFSQLHYLFSLWGIKHADHLRRKSDSDYARRVTVANMEQCELGHWTFLISQCHRVLGDLDADADNHPSARRHYDEALRIARGISRRDVLIEALLARGRWVAKTSEVLETSEVSQAFNDLNEALTYAVEDGYRIYEAGVRVALAWLYALTPGPSPASGRGVRAARAEAERALQMNVEMGYYWGKVDAQEVLRELSD